MTKNQYLRLALAAVICAGLSYLAMANFPILATQISWVWMSWAFIVALFSIVNYILFKGMEQRSHQSFLTFFAMAFGLKVFASLAWILIMLYIANISQYEFVGLYFTHYFLLTFLLMGEVWFQTKRK
jgi:hypothetical protein